MKILIIDSNSYIREYLQEELSSLGHDVLSEFSAINALNLWEKFQPDIVFSGATLQEIDGMEFLIRARKKYGKTTPFYIMSTFSHYHPEEYIKEGANDFIDKTKGLPIILDILVSTASSTS